MSKVQIFIDYTDPVFETFTTLEPSILSAYSFYSPNHPTSNAHLVFNHIIISLRRYFTFLDLTR